MGKKILAGVSILVASLYIANPGFGVFEIIPDNAPWIGNLDEATATAILLWGVKTIFGRNTKKEEQDILDKK